MKSDITSRKDIHRIVFTFYERLIKDKDMYPFFEDFIINKTLEHHINIITSFWEDILFNTQNYTNNVLQKHLTSHQKNTFKKIHFDTWLTYFIETINNHFKGLNAELMKNRAQSIAIVMQIKMKNPPD